MHLSPLTPHLRFLQISHAFLLLLKLVRYTITKNNNLKKYLCFSINVRMVFIFSPSVKCAKFSCDHPCLQWWQSRFLPGMTELEIVTKKFRFFLIGSSKSFQGWIWVPSLQIMLGRLRYLPIKKNYIMEFFQKYSKLFLGVANCPFFGWSQLFQVDLVSYAILRMLPLLVSPFEFCLFPSYEY